MTEHVGQLSSTQSVVPVSTALPDMQPGVRSADTPPEEREDSEPGLITYLMGSTATSYYLSLLLHVAAYAIAAFSFMVLGHHLVEMEREVTPIRASLDDFDRNAEQPKFEAVTDITPESSNSESNIQRISNNLKAVENGLIETLASDEMPSLLKTKDSENDDTGSAGFLFKLPESGLAVTKGSFTVWTEPERPRPGQRYLIIIEVRLPDSVKGYRVNDLRGTVIGSDNYRQKIPYDSKTPDSSFFTDESSVLRKITGSESIRVRSNKVQLAIRVPGAQRLVRDTIQISSRRLREKQELELVFGGR